MMRRHASSRQICGRYVRWYKDHRTRPKQLSHSSRKSSWVHHVCALAPAPSLGTHEQARSYPFCHACRRRSERRRPCRVLLPTPRGIGRNGHRHSRELLDVRHGRCVPCAACMHRPAHSRHHADTHHQTTETALSEQRTCWMQRRLACTSHLHRRPCSPHARTMQRHIAPRS